MSRPRYAVAVGDLFDAHGRDRARAEARAQRDVARLARAFAESHRMWGDDVTPIPPLARAGMVDALRRSAPAASRDPSLVRLDRMLPPFGLHHAHRWADETPEPALALLPHLRSTLEAVAIEASTAVDVDDDLRLLTRSLWPWAWSSWLNPGDGPGIRAPAKVRAATYAWSPGLDLAAQHSIQAFVGAVADAAGDHSLGALRRWGRVGTLLLLSSWASNADTTGLSAQQASRELGGLDGHDLPSVSLDTHGWTLLRLYKFRMPGPLRVAIEAGADERAIRSAVGALVRWGSLRARGWQVPNAGSDERAGRPAIHRPELMTGSRLWPELVYRAGILPPPAGEQGSTPRRRTRGVTKQEPTPAPAPPVSPSPTEPVQRVLAEIDALVGLDRVKQQVRRIVALIHVERRRKDMGLPVPPTTLHLVFTGNPGTGKTTVARLYGELLRELGMLNKGHFVEATRDDFVARYIGQTTDKTVRLCQRAYGGVLFVDEAYSLAQGRDWDYGREAIDALVKQMEDHRDELVVIAAGYPEPMSEFLDLNPGLRGRFPLTLEFDDFTNSELGEVFDTLMAEGRYRVDDDARTAAMAALASMPRSAHFANARAVRNLTEQIRLRQAERLAGDPAAELDRIVRADIPYRDRAPSRSRRRARVSKALERLDGMPGLKPVKQHVRELTDLAEVEAARRADGRQPAAAPGHLAFVGNPGTGKTTVAGLLGDLYAGLGLLESGHLIQVSRQDLVHGFGRSAAQMGAAARAARGGVLVIDEAYSLMLGEFDAPGTGGGGRPRRRHGRVPTRPGRRDDRLPPPDGRPPRRQPGPARPGLAAGGLS